MIMDDILDELNFLILNYGGYNKFAKDHGMNVNTLYEIFVNKKIPRMLTLLKICTILKLKMIVLEDLC